MQHTRIKICGITRPEDAVLAAQLGADAIGVVLYAQSARRVSLEQAQKIFAALPPYITRVGLFVDAPAEQIQQALKQLPLDVLQFQGSEDPQACEVYGKPYVKAVHVKQEAIDLEELSRRYVSAAGLLLDTYHVKQAGGTGATFNWHLIPAKHVGKPLILAGGLNAANVVQAIHQVKPYAVDVASGVEATPGIKDPAKLAAFIHEVRNADKI